MQLRTHLAKMHPCQLWIYGCLLTQAMHWALEPHISAPAGAQARYERLWPCRSDDLTRTQLRAQLAEMRPCELVLPGAPLSEATRKVLKAALRQPRTSRYSAPDSAESVLEMLEERGYFDKWPEVLKVGLLSL